MLIGFKSLVEPRRVVAILAPNSAPLQRLRVEAEQEGRLIDASRGRKTRAMIITDSNHVILAANTPETLWERLREARRQEMEEMKNLKPENG